MCVRRDALHLPDLFTAGVTWHATRHLDAVGIVRWVRYGSYDQITIRLVGPSGDTLLGKTLPDQLSCTAVSRIAGTCGRVWFTHPGPGPLERDAAPGNLGRAEANVNAAAVDGPKLEPALATEFTLGRHLKIAVGYALAWMFPVTVGNSTFDPTAAAALPAGGRRSFLARMPDAPGRPGAPTAAGSYKMLQHTLGS